jgi:hypothetical protein
MGKKEWLKLAALSGMLYFGNMSANSIPPAENLLQPIVSTPHYNVSSEENIEEFYRSLEPNRNVAFKVFPLGDSKTEMGGVFPAWCDSFSITFDERNYPGISNCYRVIDYNIESEGILSQYLSKASVGAGRIITEINPHWTTLNSPSEIESSPRISLTTPQPDSLYSDGEWFRIRGLPLWPDSSKYGFFFSGEGFLSARGSNLPTLIIYKRDKHGLDEATYCDFNGDNDVDEFDGINLLDNIGRHYGDIDVAPADSLFQDSAHIYDIAKDPSDIFPAPGSNAKTWDDRVTIWDLREWILNFGKHYGAEKRAMTANAVQSDSPFYFVKTENEGKITYSVISDVETGNIRCFSLKNIEGLVNGEFEIASGNLMDNIQTSLGYSKPMKVLTADGTYIEMFDKRIDGGAVFYQNPAVSIETEKVIPDSMLSANLTIIEKNEDGNLIKQTYKLSVAEAGSGLAGGRNEAGSSGTVEGGRNNEEGAGNIRADSLTGILSEEPYEFSVKPPYPNPFNSIINIQFTLPKNLEARLDIFNVSGQRIRTIESDYNKGINTETWDGKDDEGNISPSGIYFFRLKANDTEENKTFENTGKITVLR